MEIQGSSLTPLQRQIMTAFINAGGSYDGGPAVQPVRQPIVDESNRIQRQQDNNELLSIIERTSPILNLNNEFDLHLPYSATNLKSCRKFSNKKLIFLTLRGY